MATTYTWDVSTVDTYPTATDSNEVTASDVIFNVHWRVTGDDGTNQTTIIGTQVLDTEDLSSFTDFDSVTLADVEAWVKASMGADRVSEIEASLDAQLAELATPSVVTRVIGATEESAE